MTLAAGVGADLELGPLTLDALAGLRASVDTLQTTLRKIRDMEEMYAQGGIDIELGGVASTASSVVDIVIGLGENPAVGRMWELRSLAVSPTNPETTVTGTAYLLRSPTVPLLNGGPPMGGQLLDIATSIPAVAFYSQRQVVVHNPNKLFVVITGGSASTQYVVRGTVIDVPDIARRGRVDL